MHCLTCCSAITDEVCRLARSLFSSYEKILQRACGGSRPGEESEAVRGEGHRVQILPAVEHRAWQPEAAVRLTISSSGAQSLAPISVPTLLRRTVERSPDSPALRCREEGGGQVDWTYSQYYQEVETVARAWISLGLLPHHTLSVLGHPHPRQEMAHLY